MKRNVECLLTLNRMQEQTTTSLNLLETNNIGTYTCSPYSLKSQRSEGILVSLTGNFCGYPKAPSTPLRMHGKIALAALTKVGSVQVHRGSSLASLPCGLNSRCLVCVRQCDVLQRHIFLHAVQGSCSPLLIPGTHLTRRHIGRLQSELRALHMPLSRACSASVLCR